MANKIMIVGLGLLGAQVLDLLVRTERPQQIIVAGRDLKNIRERVNLSDQVALNLGYLPNIQCVELDLWNVQQTAETIGRLKPDVIFHAASLMSWWVPRTLPDTMANELTQARPGWRLPMHLTLLRRLMLAVSDSGEKIRVVNAAYPDATHAVLVKIGLAPEVGIGNIGNVVPAIRRSAAYILNERVEEVEIRLVGHHAFSYQVPSNCRAVEYPHHLSVFVRGRDVTDSLDIAKTFQLLQNQFKRPRGLSAQINTAAAAVSVLDAMISKSGRIVHAPGPNGLVGGYPVQIDEHGTHVVLPSGLTMEAAVAVNESGQKLDGIEAILNDGTVLFTESHMRIVKRILGYERLQMKIEEIEDCAQEIEIKFAELVERTRFIGV